MHYYKFNVAGWAKDTSHLSLKEEAIYLRLINFYYDHEKPIPLKTHLVLRKLRMADESETVELILEEFFSKTKDGWTHNHCEKLIGEYQKMAERNKKNAKLGGRPKINDLDKPSGNQDGIENNPTGIPNYKLETNNQEPETNNQTRPPKVGVDFSVLQVSDSDLEEIKRIRKKNRGGSLTQRVVNALAKEFEKAGGMGFTLDEVLTEWEVRSWKSFKADWMPKKQSQSGYSRVTQQNLNNLDGEW